MMTENAPTNAVACHVRDGRVPPPATSRRMRARKRRRSSSPGPSSERRAASERRFSSRAAASEQVVHTRRCRAQASASFGRADPVAPRRSPRGDRSVSESRFPPSRHNGLMELDPRVMKPSADRRRWNSECPRTSSVVRPSISTRSNTARFLGESFWNATSKRLRSCLSPARTSGLVVLRSALTWESPDSMWRNRPTLRRWRRATRTEMPMSHARASRRPSTIARSAEASKKRSVRVSGVGP